MEILNLIVIERSYAEAGEERAEVNAPPAPEPRMGGGRYGNARYPLRGGAK
jgi:hypothetical protein